MGNLNNKTIDYLCEILFQLVITIFPDEFIDQSIFIRNEDNQFHAT